MLAVTALLWILYRLAGLRSERHGGLSGVLLCVLTLGLIAAWYTMRGAGVMDYKCTAAVNLVWIAVALTVMQGGMKNATDEA